MPVISGANGDADGDADGGSPGSADQYRKWL